MIWISYDLLNKLYNFHMATVVGTISRHGLWIEVSYRNQPNKTKLVLCKLLYIYTYKSYVKQLYKQQVGMFQL